MVDKALVQRKLALLQNKKEELLRYKITRLEDLKSKGYMQKAVEKMLQEMIEICIDIAKHIIADEKLRIPEDAKDSFSILLENNILSAKTVQIMQRMTGFRNILVHLYEKTDVEIVYGVYKNRLPDFDQFSKEVLKYLRK